MKLYIWKNGRTDSDFTEEDNFVLERYGEEREPDHSSCLVVLAPNLEEARKYGEAHRIRTEPVEIDLTQHGDVVFADGEC